MKVRVLFVHPTTGMHDVTVENASSLDEVKQKLEEANCGVLTIEEDM